MTYGEIFTQVLLELGVEKKMTTAILNHVREVEPKTKLDKELSNLEAEALLEQLRQGKAGIRGWLLRGKFLVTPPEGSA